MNVSLVKLQYFVDVVDEGTFSKAALKNRIAQTSISQQIKELEQYYQCELIKRQQPVVMTQAGKVLYRNAKKVLQQFTLLEEQMEKAKNNQVELNIEYASIVDIQSLNLLLKGKKQPNFTLHKVNLGEIASNLLSGKYDFAVTFDSEFQGVAGVETKELTSGEYWLGVSQNNPLAKENEVTLTQLESYPLVMLSPKIIGKSYDIMIKRSQGKLKINRIVDDIESEIFYMKQENLLGFFPKTYELTLKEEGIKLVKIIDSPHVYSVVLAWRKVGLTEIQKHFIEV
ncbi:LysR family transcriptional regulator [Ligilactobacillus agilis]|uniref:LysR family transcriptional regulator n=1 Tax=Ligilactobacillus agilis TaxID=1601 RepID=A0A6F9XL28_9LACO|nr:LysR family transcriptional regulator [Ligilactobacillus agilis]UNL41706.1 LysR family transcriptional regulator [Ligilactobacillus agilis]UNL58861.1 LysR family transcriptional regulator [Ligilactobacillus agilis]GET05974.1 LysR family transcriptional regulator [Ligilactobacillus agilis]